MYQCGSLSLDEIGNKYIVVKVDIINSKRLLAGALLQGGNCWFMDLPMAGRERTRGRSARSCSSIPWRSKGSGRGSLRGRRRQQCVGDLYHHLFQYHVVLIQVGDMMWREEVGQSCSSSSWMWSKRIPQHLCCMPGNLFKQIDSYKDNFREAFQLVENFGGFNHSILNWI